MKRWFISHVSRESDLESKPSSQKCLYEKCNFKTEGHAVQTWTGGAYNAGVENVAPEVQNAYVGNTRVVDCDRLM